MRKLTQVLFVVLLLIGLISTTRAQSEPPTLYGILLDNSGSLRSQFDRVLALGNGAVEDAHKHGPISIFSFKGTANPKDSPPLKVAHTIWNQDPAVLSRYLDNLFIEGGQTNLLDAVHSMVNYINARAEQDKTPNVRKVLVLITDGEDRKSKIKEQELLAELQQHQIKVYAIGLVQELDNEAGLMRPSSKRRAIKFLTSVTKETGGRALFPKNNKDAVSVLIRELFAVQP
jgi:hypothetical protein